MYEAAQTFTTDFRFNRIDIAVNSGSCYKPSSALIELYNSDNFQENTFKAGLFSVKHYLQTQIPIARAMVMVPPGLRPAWVSISFKKQEPGTYCWLLRNMYDEDPASMFFVVRKTPKQYTGGYSYLNRWRDEGSDYSSIIYGISASTERYLISKGTVETLAGVTVTVDAPATNPITVEGKGDIAQVGDVVRDSKGRAVGVIVSGSEVFEQGEIIARQVTFNVHTPQKYPVYNAKVMKDGTELGRTDRQGKLIAMVEVGTHTFKGEKSISKKVENKSASDISKLTEIQME